MRTFLILCGVIVCSVTAGFACYQIDLPKVVLSTHSLNLRATDDNRAQVGRVFQLHKAITLDSQEARYKGYYDKTVLKSATTDSLGLASFGDVEPGAYWIVARGDRFGVRVLAPIGERPKRLWLKRYADGCIAAVGENAD